MAGRTWQQSSLPEGEGGDQLQGDLKSGRFISCQGNKERGISLIVPLINYHHWDSSDLRIKTVTSGGQEPVCRHLLIRLCDLEGRSVMWIRCRWGWNWSSRGWTESKRTAIWGGLTSLLTAQQFPRTCGHHSLRVLKICKLSKLPGGLVVRIPGIHCHGPGSVPTQGAEIQPPIHLGRKKKEKNQKLFDPEISITGIHSNKTHRSGDATALHGNTVYKSKNLKTT